MHQEVHTLVSGASGLQRGHLFSRVINEEEENSGWQHLLRLNDEKKSRTSDLCESCLFPTNRQEKEKQLYRLFVIV